MTVRLAMTTPRAAEAFEEYRSILADHAVALLAPKLKLSGPEKATCRAMHAVLAVVTDTAWRHYGPLLKRERQSLINDLADQLCRSLGIPDTKPRGPTASTEGREAEAAPIAAIACTTCQSFSINPSLTPSAPATLSIRVLSGGGNFETHVVSVEPDLPPNPPRNSNHSTGWDLDTGPCVIGLVELARTGLDPQPVKGFGRKRRQSLQRSRTPIEPRFFGAGVNPEPDLQKPALLDQLPQASTNLVIATKVVKIVAQEDGRLLLAKDPFPNLGLKRQWLPIHHISLTSKYDTKIGFFLTEQ